MALKDRKHLAKRRAAEMCGVNGCGRAVDVRENEWRCSAHKQEHAAYMKWWRKKRSKR